MSGLVEALPRFPGCPVQHFVPRAWLGLPKCPICLVLAERECDMCDGSGKLPILPGPGESVNDCPKCGGDGLGGEA